MMIGYLPKSTFEGWMYGVTGPIPWRIDNIGKVNNEMERDSGGLTPTNRTFENQKISGLWRRVL
jgi:hypothetical protein